MLKSYSKELTITYAEDDIRMAVVFGIKKLGGYNATDLAGLKELRFEKFYGDCVLENNLSSLMDFGLSDVWQLTYSRTNYQGRIEYTYITVETINLDVVNDKFRKRLDEYYK